MRYEFLADLVSQVKPATILEVGTNAGARAKLMAAAALQHAPKVHYIGYDLFEDATAQTDEREFNVKPHMAREMVEADLRLFAKQHPGFSFDLRKGDTNHVLEETTADFAFIDGGHSIDTIANDFGKLKQSRCVVLDDYYSPDDDHRIPDVTKVGCNALINDLIAQKKEVTVLPFADPVQGGGKVHMAVVNFKPTFRTELDIKTKNSVPDQVIRTNIRAALDRDVARVPHCKPHALTCVMVSAGPSYKDYLDDIRALSREPNCRVVCVKHNHDALLAEDINVWGCVLLDPREHVKDFVQNPRDDVTYMVASQCEPAVFDQLNGHRTLLYHAHVAAGEETLIDLKKEFLVGGGAAAATRGIAVMHTMGFRRFVLFGYDGQFNEKPENGVVVELPGLEGQPPRQFYTDALRAVEGQDLRNLVQTQGGMYMDIEGDGMLPHMFNLLVEQGVAHRLSDLEEFPDVA